jgi:hypothetical protein
VTDDADQPHGNAAFFAEHAGELSFTSLKMSIAESMPRAEINAGQRKNKAGNEAAIKNDSKTTRPSERLPRFSCKAQEKSPAEKPGLRLTAKSFAGAVTGASNRNT